MTPEKKRTKELGDAVAFFVDEIGATPRERLPVFAHELILSSAAEGIRLVELQNIIASTWREMFVDEIGPIQPITKH